MRHIIRTCFCLLMTSACFVSATAQNRPIIGVNINSDFYSDAIRPSLGLTLETHLTKHSGLESGIFYRTQRIHTTFLTVDSLDILIFPLVISQRFINVPLLYKYYGKKLNVSIGPLLDFYVNWKQKTPKSEILTNGFDAHPTLRVGFLGKVSKSFMVGKKFILEPELRVGFLRNTNELGAGAGIAGKYQF